MAVAGTPGDAGGVSTPGSGNPDPVRRRWRVRWLVAGSAVLVALALLIPGLLAARYQPISYGSVGNSAELFPGLPGGQGIHPVNDLGGFHEDIYLPPQRGVFSLFADIANNGSYPITIESVALPQGGPILAGPVRYSTPGMGGSNEIPPPTSRMLHDVVLLPGHEMYLGFPVRTWPCASRDIWTGLQSFNVRVRFALFTRTVAVPWGDRGDSLIMHEPGGRPGDPDTFCLPHTVLPKPRADNQPFAIAGTILRVYKGRDVGELRITEMTAPDAASLNPPYPRCMLQHTVSQHLVNFDLNWAAINFGQTGTAPAVHLTITGPHGEAVIAVVPTGPNGNQICSVVRSLALSPEGTGSQLVYGLFMRLPVHAALHELGVEIDGHPITIHLSPVCSGSNCFQDNPPVPYTPGTPYSVQLSI
jgi:hypothetical protein